jgi:hypothetical protein
MSDLGEVPGIGAPFIDQLVDWRAFEDFVRELYAMDPNVVAERDVTEIGRSGARRQIDVKLTQVIDGAPKVTLIECKRWKKKVDRQRIDVLAAGVEDLGAARGIMFTTSGYERGAEAYARHKGIEIFVVRDLTEHEWGLPGRMVWFYLHYYGSRFTNLDFGPVMLVSLVSDPPGDLGINLVIGKDQPHDPSLTLHSVTDGSPGPNLSSLLIEARNRTLEILSGSIEAWDVETEGETKAFRIPLELDLSGQEHRQLMRNFGALRLDGVRTDLVATVTQSRFEADRGVGLDLALAVENYVTNARRFVARRDAGSDLSVMPANESADPADPPDPEVLQNGVVMKVILEAWVAAPDVQSAVSTAAVAFRLPDWKMTIAQAGPAPPRSPGRP